MWVIVAVILGLSLFPVVRFAVCRLHMMLYWKRFCRSVGAELRFRTVFSPFDRWGGAENSLYIRLGDRVWSVRLIGFFFRKTHLRIYSPMQYLAANYSVPVAGWVLRTATPEVKTNTKCDFHAFLPQEQEEIRPCFLVSEETYITYGREGAGISVCDGDRIDGVSFFTSKGLAEEIRKCRDDVS